MLAMRRSLALVSLVSLVPLALAGCPWLDGPDEPAGPPCEDDVNGCDNGDDEFIEDPTCELTGELDVELGQGEDSFTPLAPGEMPEIFTGLQGGQHVWMGVRVKNPDLTRPSLKIRISLSYCEVDCDDPANWQADNVRELVAGSRTLEVTDEGWFEQASMLVTLFAYGFAEHKRVEMLVTDPCSRQGLAVVEE
jgi:hypothetical protein